MTAAHDRRVRGVAQMLMASNFAEVVWTGLATKHIRDSFAGFIDLPNLKKSWAIVSPDSYIPNLADNDTKLLMITGKYDPVFLPYLSKEIIDMYKEYEVDYYWKELSCGHYTIGEIRPICYTLGKTLLWLRGL